jgi:aminodeoxychorismate synthase component I
MEGRGTNCRNLAKEPKMGGDGKWCRMAPAFMSCTGNPTRNIPHTVPSPIDAALRLRHRKHFVWLDSSSETSPRQNSGKLSLLACEPDLILEGVGSDWHLLEKELERRERSSPNPGIPDGAAIGYFRFDGSFRFGFYDNLFIHTRGDWIGDAADLLGKSELGDPESYSMASPPSFRPETGRDDYVAMVRAAQEYVAAGDIYQVCLAHRFSAPFSGNPWPLYMSLREASPSPHAAFLNFPDEAILSSSPECFLKISGRAISTHPIKGTRPRKSDRNEDESTALELKTSPKEIAELVMITDLERNDLGSVCEYGSVNASQLLHLERYAQVFHLVSTVEGKLRKDVTQVAALRACFPGGSISGAPKKRALEIIRELEPSPRGLFTGAIGYFGYNGESQFNIAIRTVEIRDGKAAFNVGAGITAGSIPEKEWEETLHKAAGILQASGCGGL